jgi:hypothetical protein
MSVQLQGLFDVRRNRKGIRIRLGKKWEQTVALSSGRLCNDCVSLSDNVAVRHHEELNSFKSSGNALWRSIICICDYDHEFS